MTDTNPASTAPNTSTASTTAANAASGTDEGLINYLAYHFDKLDLRLEETKHNVRKLAEAMNMSAQRSDQQFREMRKELDAIRAEINKLDAATAQPGGQR